MYDKGSFNEIVSKAKDEVESSLPSAIPSVLFAYRRLSMACVASTIDQVLSRRFVRHEQMYSTIPWADLLLKTGTAILYNEREEVCR